MKAASSTYTREFSLCNNTASRCGEEPASQEGRDGGDRSRVRTRTRRSSNSSSSSSSSSSSRRRRRTR